MRSILYHVKAYGMRGRELLLTVLASLLTCAVVIYVSGPTEQPYEPEVLEISLENATIIKCDPDWARGTWFDWDPAHIYGYDYWIIVEPR